VVATVFEFGDFKLDCDRFELYRAGQSLKLERKPMELLILLVARNGHLVTRTEIAQRLWASEVFVDTEHGINTAIRKIRQALRENPDKPRFLLTVTGKGYRFVGVEANAHLGGGEGRLSSVVASNSNAHALEPRVTTILFNSQTSTAVASIKELRTRYKFWVIATMLTAVVTVGLTVRMRKLRHPEQKHETETRATANPPVSKLQKIEGWYITGSRPDQYEFGIDNAAAHDGHASLYLRSKGLNAQGFGAIGQSFRAEKYAGKRMRFSAFAKSEEVENWAGLWMRVDKGTQILDFDNMQSRAIRGTIGWKNYDIVLDVPQDATAILIGALLNSSGTVWVSGPKFEIVGRNHPLTKWGLKEPTNLEFENR